MLNPYAQHEANRYRTVDRRRQAEYDHMSGVSSPGRRSFPIVFGGGLVLAAAAVLEVLFLVIL